MEIKTQAAMGIDSIELEKARLDASCRKILSYKVILAFIIKQCVDELKDYSVDFIAEKCIEGAPQVNAVSVQRDESSADPGVVMGIDGEDFSVDEGLVRFDIFVKVIVPGTDKEIVLYINVEAQGNTDKLSYPLSKRALYYCCREISRQYGREFIHSHYEKLKKVYSIWICFSPPDNKKNTIVKYFVEKNDVFGSTQEIKESYDLINVVMLNIGDNECECEILNMLHTLFSETMPSEDKKNILESRYNIAMTREVFEEVDHMCNYSEYIERRGIEKGLADGREDGIFRSLKSLMEKLSIPAEKAMELLSVPANERESLMKMLSA